MVQDGRMLAKMLARTLIQDFHGRMLAKMLTRTMAQDFHGRIWHDGEKEEPRTKMNDHEFLIERANIKKIFFSS
jgi:hypothetical protein